jgi:hypothetical protein
LNSALVGGEWGTSFPGRFNAEEIDAATHWIRGLVGSRAGLDMEK